MRINERQLAQVDAQIKRLIASDNYYGRKYKELGITGVASEEDFLKLPIDKQIAFKQANPEVFKTFMF